MSELPSEPVDLMTVSEVAALLRVSTMTVYRLVDAGLLRAIRIGRSLRLPRASVVEFVRDAESASPSGGSASRVPPAEPASPVPEQAVSPDLPDRVAGSA